MQDISGPDDDDFVIIRELECQPNSDDENRDPAADAVVVSEEMLYASGEGEVVNQLTGASPTDINMCLDVEAAHQHNSIHGFLLYFVNIHSS